MQVYWVETSGHEGSPDTAWNMHWHVNQERDWAHTGSMEALALRPALAAGAPSDPYGLLDYDRYLS